MRGAKKLLFRGLVVLCSTTKPPNNSFLAPRMLEHWLCTFSKKIRDSIGKISFWDHVFLEKVQSQCSNMRDANKLLFRNLVVLCSTTKPPNNSFLTPHLLEIWLCTFSKKIRISKISFWDHVFMEKVQSRCSNMRGAKKAVIPWFGSTMQYCQTSK